MDPKLRDDFPVDWEDDNYVSRREFFKMMTLASGGLAVGSVGMAAWAGFARHERQFEEALVASVADVPVGGSLQFSYPRPHDLCVLVQKEPGEFVAYSRRCTHLACPVEYQHEHSRLYCPCHNGAFHIDDGRVLMGPPPRPLPRIVLEVRGDQIYAVGVTRGDES
jgi:nitrite reductase/ring-hydroxylating ferredoxin subunit